MAWYDDQSSRMWICLLLVIAVLVIGKKLMIRGEQQAGSLIQLSANQGSIEERDLEKLCSHVRRARKDVL